ncbi:hypothetical protein GQ44DRAFT_773907 [Phaeosphaeriaceae sp. PMI808]|nr:hypothetical protein GQ44DRAFT_773907 [Phaeosphaeriaceae sp. PMI808]
MEAFKEPLEAVLETYQSIIRSSSGLGSRFSFILFYHVVDLYATLSVDLASGQTRLSAALDKIYKEFKELNINRTDVASAQRFGSKLLDCAQAWGLGFLAIMRGSRYDLERLDDESIKVVLVCRKERFPQIESASLAFNSRAVESLIDMLPIRELDRRNILKEDTKLTKLLRQYIDLQSFNGRIITVNKKQTPPFASVDLSQVINTINALRGKSTSAAGYKMPMI